MDDGEKIIALVGGVFAPIGVICDVIAAGLLVFRQWFGGLICLLIGVIFTAVGFGMLISIWKNMAARKRIAKSGVKYTGKVYGYLNDMSAVVNGDYLVNIKVHYFDEQGVEREAIIPTKFVKGSGDFPIGATIDIMKLGTSYTWVKGSVRYERIDREEELMDELPIDPAKLNMVAVSCRNCGATFTAAKGFAGKCPYCGSSVNV